MSVKKAETWFSTECACPYCGEIQEVEDAIDSEELEEGQCTSCHKAFSYAHPESVYH